MSQMAGENPTEGVAANNGSNGDSGGRSFGLTRGDVIFLVGAAIVLILLSSVHWAYTSGWGAKPIEIERLPERSLEFQIEINTATWVEWMQLEGIGDQLARRIVEDRELNGPFTSIEDLDRVKGIGPKTLANIRPHLRCKSTSP
ncbi:MAG: helix-hairpin-helix domain-containing protein [Planctomycetaceae bacterium]